MLVQRVETIALGEDLCDRGEQVTLFLFNDCLEVRLYSILTSEEMWGGLLGKFKWRKDSSKNSPNPVTFREM